MSSIFPIPERQKPGLFIASTEARGGKTVVACALAEWLARRGMRVGVFKPIAMGCHSDRGSLMSPDAEALAHFAGFDPAIGALDVIAPLRFRAQLAPAIALALRNEPLDSTAFTRSLQTLDAACDVILVEGAGGLVEPIDPDQPDVTMLDLAQELGYPIAIVSDADARSLNLAALTSHALKRRNIRPAGVVINRYNPDDPDPSMQAHRDWVARLIGGPILVTLPRVPDQEVNVTAGRLSDDLRVATNTLDWTTILRPPVAARRG